ncbi:MAG TPA: hypothetical protein ENH95_02790 [Nitrosopumilus sp.]|nr:hypothetical protein [Nitrosopumilus sp.]
MHHTTTHSFTTEELDELKKFTKKETVEEAMELWAYMTYNLKSCCDFHIKKIGKKQIQIIELD